MNGRNLQQGRLRVWRGRVFAAVGDALRPAFDTTPMTWRVSPAGGGARDVTFSARPPSTARRMGAVPSLCHAWMGACAWRLKADRRSARGGAAELIDVSSYGATGWRRTRGVLHPLRGESAAQDSLRGPSRPGIWLPQSSAAGVACCARIPTQLPEDGLQRQAGAIATRRHCATA